jgi:type II secretory pathway pseudopilin PulG
VRRSGFTLLETALTTMIVGVAFVAVLELVAAGTTSNVQATEMTTGVNLAKSVRELALTKTFAQVRAMNGDSYSPPKDAAGELINEFGDWTQKVAVQACDPTRLPRDVVDPNPDVVRVTVTVEHNNERVCDVSWYTFRKTP